MSTTTEFKSQIRQSTIQNLLTKVSKKNYGSYLVKLKLFKLRGFIDKSITFDFPVTALVGPNGGGKTTILGAAATGYSAIKPRQFFTKSGKFDSSMLNWKIEYEYIDKDTTKGDTFKRSATFQNQKWSRDAVKRETVVFGVSRTVPANERIELQKCASSTFTVSSDKIEVIQEPVAQAVSKILGKDISKFTHIKVDEKGRISLLTGITDGGDHYSEFHFGAGESSIIRMVMRIEALGDNCLILIEEIENGLHPVATIRMVEYLIEVAERKGAQAIFTTHSNDALKPLPSEAIWASVAGNVYQGKLDITSLRAISGQVDAKLAIFCEDEFAKTWLRCILRSIKNIAIDAIEIHAMKGDGTAVIINKNHNNDPSSKFPSVCYIDGDSKQIEKTEESIIRLPGKMPEDYIFDSVMDQIDKCGGLLSVRLLQPFHATSKVIDEIQKTRTANRDPHILYSQIGQQLGFIPESTVRDSFISTWVESYPDIAKAIIAPIEKLLPKESSEIKTSINEAQERLLPGLE